MFLFSRLSSRGPQLIATFLIFSLSAGILGGVLFYMDQTAPLVLDDFTRDLDIDMEVTVTSSFYKQNTTSVSDIEYLLDEHVSADYEPISILNTYTYYQGQDYYQYIPMVFMGIGSSFTDTFPDAVYVSDGAPTLTEDTCYMESGFFNDFGYSIGDYFNATLVTYDDNWNEIVYSKVYRIVGTFESNIFEIEYYYYGYGYYDGYQRETDLTIITTKDSLNAAFGAAGFGLYRGVTEKYWISIDESSIVSQSTIEDVFDSLDTLRRRFEQEALPFAYVSSFELREAVGQYQIWASTMTMLAISFSIPTVLMGILLVYYDSTLRKDETRRDIGTIKTRGASGWQAFHWIIGTAIIVAIIGSLGALAVGGISAMLSTTVKTFFVFDLAQLTIFTNFISWPSVISVFIFSFSVGLVTALPMAIRSFMMTATEAHSILERTNGQSSEEFGNVMYDVIGLGISGYMILFTLGWMAFSIYFGQMQLFMLTMIVPATAILILTFTRILSRPTAAFKAKVIEKFRLKNKVSPRVLARTLHNYKKSEALGVVFISLVFTVSVMSGISAETATVHTNSVFMFRTGADIAVTVKSDLNNVTIDFLENITSVDGVSTACPVFKVNQHVQYSTAYYYSTEYINESMLIYGVDPTLWRDSAFWLPYFTLDNEPSVAIDKMLENDTNVIASFRPVDHYEGSGFARNPVYKNSIRIQFRPDRSRPGNFTYMKIVDVLGQSNDRWQGLRFLQGEPSENRFLVVNIDLVHRYMNTTAVNKFLIHIEDGADYKAVMGEIYALAPSSFASIESPHTDIEAVINSKASQSVYGVYTLNVIFTLLYLSLGMTIVAGVRMNSMKKNFSILRALGTDEDEIRKTVVMDAALNVVLAILIGAILGVILAVFSTAMPLIHIGTDTLYLWFRLPVTVQVPWLILMLIAAYSFGIAIAATYVVSSSLLRKNIAEEIQYAE